MWSLLCCVPLQSIVTYTQRMQAAGKEVVIEPPLHQQPTAEAQEADQDSDEEERWVCHGGQRAQIVCMAREHTSCVRRCIG